MHTTSNNIMICSKRDKRRSIYASPFIMKSHAWQAVSCVISDSLGLFLYQTTSDIIHVSHCSIHISFLFVFEKTDGIRQYKKLLQPSPALSCTLKQGGIIRIQSKVEMQNIASHKQGCTMNWCEYMPAIPAIIPRKTQDFASIPGGHRLYI